MQVAEEEPILFVEATRGEPHEVLRQLRTQVIINSSHQLAIT